MTDPSVFIHKENGREFKIRTACLILICHEQVVMIRDAHNKEAHPKTPIIEFPGGKVEELDKNIYDTVGREIWEELFLQGHHEGNYLKNWPEIKRQIINNYANVKNATWIEIISRLLEPVPGTNKPQMGKFKKSGSDLKTMYFVITIPKHVAKYLEKECEAYLVDIKSLQDARTVVCRDCSEPAVLSRYMGRNVEVPVGSQYIRIRDRELFCLPRSIL